MTGPTPGIQRALALLAVSRPERALAELAQLPTDEATSQAAFRVRVLALNLLHRYREAAKTARVGLTQGPDPDLLGSLAEALLNLGDLAGAERALLAALEIAPTDPGLLCSYATVCLRAGQFDKAEALIERSAAEDPGSAEIYLARIQLAYLQGKDVEAQKLSQEFLATYPELPAAQATLASMDATRGRVRPAYRGMRQAAANSPRTGEWAKAAVDLRVATHPLMWPLRPLLRFGPAKTLPVFSVPIFLLAVIAPRPLTIAIGLPYCLYCLYSWVVPPLVRRRLQRGWRRAPSTPEST